MSTQITGPPRRPSVGPAVLESPHQFLLLRVHRDDRLTALLKTLDHCVDMLKLRIAVGMILSLLRLAVALQTIAGSVEQPPHGARADGMPLFGQRRRQLGCALCGPAQRRLRIAPRHRIYELLQSSA